MQEAETELIHGAHDVFSSAFQQPCCQSTIRASQWAIAQSIHVVVGRVVRTLARVYMPDSLFALAVLKLLVYN